MQASTRAFVRTTLRDTLLYVFDLSSSSDRGRGTNAARVSILVSRIPSTFPLNRSARYHAFYVEPDSFPLHTSRDSNSGGANSGTWAVSGRVTPNRVAPLPARRARQMFFVADYDAVCAIMTTSLSLSHSHRCALTSLCLSFFPSRFSPSFHVPRRFPLSLVGFFLSFSSSLSLSLSVSPRYLLPVSSPTGTNFALASADVVSDTRGGD